MLFLGEMFYFVSTAEPRTGNIKLLFCVDTTRVVVIAKHFCPSPTFTVEATTVEQHRGRLKPCVTAATVQQDKKRTSLSQRGESFQSEKKDL
jgi:hypothetical protein